MIPYKLNYAYLRRGGEPKAKYDLTVDLTNCSGSFPSQITEGKEYEVSITADEGYYLDYSSFSATGLDVNYDEDSGKVSFVSNEAAEDCGCQLSVEAWAEGPEPGDTWHITYVAQNCTLTGPDEVDDGDDFWVDGSADEGYHFEFEPEIDGDYDDMGGSMVDCDCIQVHGCHSDLTITAVASPD